MDRSESLSIGGNKQHAHRWCEQGSRVRAGRYGLGGDERIFPGRFARAQGYTDGHVDRLVAERDLGPWLWQAGVA
jgi:hypothetical protein